MRYRRNPNCAGRIVDGLAFVITPQDNKLHTLNRAATELWQRAQQDLSAAAAADALTEIFEVDRETAEQDVATCFADLVARGILIAIGE